VNGSYVTLTVGAAGRYAGGMTEQPQESEQADEGRRIVVVGPDGMAVETADPGDGGDDEPSVTDLVEQPAKVMRIGNMIRQLLDEVKAAPLDEASRARLREIHAASIKELEDGLAPELIDELERLSLPFSSGTPSDAELRIAQAQLVGWLEGLFHGIQTAIYAQQMAARAQLEQMRRALPSGAPGMPEGPGGRERPAKESDRGHGGGMYL
jgi:Protein of unknown function (DUF2587)